MRRGRMLTPRLAAALGVCLLAAGCAEAIPKGSYGVSALDIDGVEQFDAETLEVCLATHPRERFDLVLGSQEPPRCGVPPFDTDRTRLNLWAWPWTDWPLFSAPAFVRDKSRIERWYRARGYYEARVVETIMVRDEEDRTIEILLRVLEGKPVLVIRLQIDGLDEIPEDVVEEIRDVLELELGGPFDEARYERSKRRIVEVLQEASYAKASATGSVEIDPRSRIARVTIKAEPGPACTFGDVIIQGQAESARPAILGAAQIDSGDPFSLSALADARRAIFELGPFSAVETEPHPRPDSPVIDVLIRTTRAREVRFGVGVGLESGGLYAQDATEDSGDSFAQWDVHLSARLEHRDFLGGMRRLRVEDRPRLIFDQPFPGTADSAPGNLLIAELRQPAFIEPRTTLVARTRWDRGPDPFGGKFLRHDLMVGIGPERRFLHGLLKLSTMINLDLFLPDDEDPYPSYDLTYLRHMAALDLRDDPSRTRKGAYFNLTVLHAGYFLPSAWDLFRITQEARGYVPLPFGMVLATRARLGLMHVSDTTIEVPPAMPMDTSARFIDNLARFGPLRHRLRGGGHNSVRGYAPNTLGDVERVEGRLLSGGLRQWLASVELRVPVFTDLGAVAFMDAGDVSQSTSWRFDHPQTSVGIGLRYRTLVGPLRLDAAVAPSALQVIGTDDRIRDVRDSTDTVTGPLPRVSAFGVEGLAVHFTIGEAF